MNIHDIKLIASAVRAGEESALKGEVGNPFDGVNEHLRLAFHFGWSAQQPMGDSFYTVETLLRLATSVKHPVRFPVRGVDCDRADCLAEIDKGVSVHPLAPGDPVSPLQPV
ncbi:hypothetical protein [Paraburkholderia sp.]|jgi:hypothetical protein|uniref:hypothetical protein n=1 Tax=Paraburkholderia sp. TaxID=1926495 RepID=UPI003C7BB353